MNDTKTVIKETPFAKYLLLATIVFYVVVGLLWMQATPLQPITLPDNLPQARAEQPLLVGEGPDEKEHFLYILSLSARGRIPKPSPNYRTSPEEYVSYQAQHPPLFYAAAALIYKMAHPALGDTNIWYFLRAICLLCGIGVIVLADKAAKLAFPDRPLVACATAPFVAFLPMFGHMTGNLSNEPLAMLFGAAVWYQAVRILRSPEPLALKNALILGATLGLACLTRLTALMWLPVVLIALSASLKKGGRPVNIVAALVVLGVLLAPWLMYNQAAYGHAFLRTFDRPLLANGTLSDFFGHGIVPKEFPVPVNLTQTLLWYAGTAWLPFWLTQFYQPDLRPYLLLLDAIAAVLIVLNIGKVIKDDAPDNAGKAIIVAALSAVTFCFAALIQQQLFSDWNVVLSAGRYLVAAAPATGLLFVWALSTIRPLDRPVVAAVVTVGMLAFDINAALTVRQFYIDHPKQPDTQPITRVVVPSRKILT